MRLWLSITDLAIRKPHMLLPGRSVRGNLRAKSEFRARVICLKGSSIAQHCASGLVLDLHVQASDFRALS